MLLQRANAALRLPRVTDGPAVLDQVQVQSIMESQRDGRSEYVVRLVRGGILRNPPQPFRHTEDVRVDRKRRSYGLQLYAIWWMRLEIGSNAIIWIDSFAQAQPGRPK